MLPVIEGIRSRTDRPISVDTRKAEVARAAVAAGADLVNDVSALRYDPEMLPFIAREKAGIVLMHMRGTDPRTMQAETSYAHPVADVASELAAAASRAMDAGVDAGAIAIDPGLGFGKSPPGNLDLLLFPISHALKSAAVIVLHRTDQRMRQTEHAACL